MKWQQNDNQNDLDAYLTGPFALFGQEHELVAGVSASSTRGKSSNYNWLYGWNSDYNGTLGNIWTWDGSGANRPEFDRTGKTHSRETQYSAYLTSRLNLTDSTHLIVGSRVIDWKSDATTVSTEGLRSKSSRKESGVVVPFAGVIQDLDDTWSVYGSYTQIFNPQG